MSGSASATEGSTPTHYGQVLQNQIEEGLTALRRPQVGTFLSSLNCGLDLGMGPFLLLMVLTAFSGVVSEPVVRVLMSVGYTFGFVFVVLGRSELFTEHTILAVVPVLVGEEGWRELAELWGLVYAGNIVGGTAFAGFAVVAGPALGVVDPSVMEETAMTFVDLTPTGVFTGALMAGWLMALLAWILTSVGDTISRIAVIVITTFIIGFGHLPHCVAGNIEVLMGIFVGADITWGQWAQFLAVTSVGNAVGGVVFVTLMKYGHAVHGVEEQDVEREPHVDDAGTGDG